MKKIGSDKEGYYVNVDFLKISDDPIVKINQNTYAIYIDNDGNVYLNKGGVHTEILADIFKISHDEFLDKLRNDKKFEKDVRDNIYDKTISGRYWEKQGVMTYRNYTPSRQECITLKNEFKKIGVDITKSCFCFDLYLANENGCILFVPFDEYLDMHFNYKQQIDEVTKKLYMEYKKKQEDTYWWNLPTYEEFVHNDATNTMNEFCETSCPNTPPCSMGEISFPQNGNFGSGDVVCTSCKDKRKKKKVKPYIQKPAKTIMSFDEFVNGK